MTIFKREADFEQAFIEVLIDKGWECEVLKNKTEADLLQNWANILFENNRQRDRLNDVPLTKIINYEHRFRYRYRCAAAEQRKDPG